MTGPFVIKILLPGMIMLNALLELAERMKDLPQLPDGQFIPPFEMNCVEKHLKKRIEEKFKESNLIESRMAVFSQPHNGRGKCMSRNLCHRGCPYGAYFSSNSSTLPAAYATGNLTLTAFL